MEETRGQVFPGIHPCMQGGKQGEDKGAREQGRPLAAEAFSRPSPLPPPLPPCVLRACLQAQSSLRGRSKRDQRLSGVKRGAYSSRCSPDVWLRSQQEPLASFPLELTCKRLTLDMERALGLCLSWVSSVQRDSRCIIDERRDGARDAPRVLEALELLVKYYVHSSIEKLERVV